MTGNLLVLRALGLGDLLVAVPALRGLRRAHPRHRIVLAAPAWLEPLAVLSGVVDEVVPTEPLGPIPAALPAVAVNLHGRGPQSHRRLLETAPRSLIWFRSPGVPESESAPEWRDDEHEAARWCRLLAAYGIDAHPDDLDLAPPALAPPPPAAGATVIHPGAAYGSRRWPAERWAAVVRAERTRGRRVAVTGGPGEEALAREVARRGGLEPEAVLTRLSLLELAAAVAAAARLASPDTGVAHLATALGTPSVVLFGPSSPAAWGPPRTRPGHRVLWSGTTGDPFAADPDPGLLRITPEQVSAALAS